ncbi:hypothetical protein ANCCAN_23277 [Ancylostoma caninum]|uniref:Serine-threonine/tyrosine-protein kinase catalytic domain-containing protein n=1 Tax=Ancylostoma caninum TaxID=29170 RepID=A0A368FJB7_ANCCA|nr:hypothetical protein ANCCAN_23277 [Ancylostoma caninum]
MMDIASGLNYIHESSMGVHGRLTSQYCVVDDRWQVKVSYYGMSSIKEFEQRTIEEGGILLMPFALKLSVQILLSLGRR